MAIDKGNDEAMFKLPKMLCDGDGVLINKTEAINYYMMAIEKGNNSAINKYASMLYFGDDVPINKIEAIRLLKMAIDKGDEKICCFSYSK